MRKRASGLVFAPLWVAMLAAPVLAQDDAEEEEGGAFSEYLEIVGNRYQVGLNSLVTFPADPVMGTVEPREEFDELPLAEVTKWPVGFAQGTLLGALRAGTGTFDLLFAPLTPMRMLSPEPRYMIFPDAEHEEY